MNGLLGVGEERHQISDTLGLGDGSMQSGKVEGEGCLGADRVAAVESVVADTDDETEVGEDIDEGLLVEGGNIGEVVDLGVLGAFLKPVGNLLVGGNVSIAGIVRINERGEEVLVDAVDLVGVIEEGEVLEGVFSVLVDKAAGLQVGVEVASLITALGGPDLGDVVTATIMLLTSNLKLLDWRLLLTQRC